MKDQSETFVSSPNNRVRGVVTAFAAFVMFALAAFMVVSGIYFIAREGFVPSLTIVLIGAFTGILGLKTWNEAIYALRWRLTATSDALHLELPRGRSYLHDLKPYRGTIARTAIIAIVMRLEGYRSIGGTNIHRVFALQLDDGSFLHLGEDRALGTRMYRPFHDRCAQSIAERFELPIIDRGMVMARGGLFGLFGIRVPAWDAPVAGDADASDIWRRARRTGLFAMLAVWLVFLVQALHLFR